MNYHELHTQVIDKLRKNERPKILLTPELIAELKTGWHKAISEIEVDVSGLTKILCILDNTRNTTSELNALFILTFDKIRDPNLLIYTLAASQKHVIDESLRSGNMISSAYFLKLKELLKSKNPEVVEWTLRTIETMGPLSLRLESDVQSVNLGINKLFNQHKKSSAQLISLMQTQWKKMRL